MVNGTFQFGTQLALNGTADGSHTVTFLATDNAGNQSSPASYTFTLDTVAPTAAITSPTTALTTNTNVTILATAADTSSGVALLQAQVDGELAQDGQHGQRHFPVQHATGVERHGRRQSHSDLRRHRQHRQRVHPGLLHVHVGHGPAGHHRNRPSPGRQRCEMTQNITVTGLATDAISGVASLQEAFDSTTGPFSPVAVQSDGSFSFTTTLATDGSADGPHTVYLRATDFAGNVSPLASLPFTLTTNTNITKLATPVLDPASDSGPSNSDGITNVTTPLIHVAAASGLNISLLVDGTPTPPTVSVNGTATFTIGPLADGPHTIVAAVETSPGQFTENSDPLSITILTKPPPVPTFDLAAGTADLGPETTSSSHVTLVGQTGPGDMVFLVGASLIALASNTGTFQIPGVTLASGANALTLQAEDAAGNTSSGSPLAVTYTPPTNATPPNAVIFWNQATLNAIQTDGTDPVMASRALAMVQAAVYDAVNNVAGTPAYYIKVAAPADSSINAAVDAAAHAVLVYLYPAQQATFDALLASQLALLPVGQGTTDGETVGQAVGNAIIALRE